jgi:ubiquitin carboxyl-terminal hydrolase 1
MSYWNHQPLSSLRYPTYQKISYIDDITSKLSSTTGLGYVALSVVLGYFTLLYMQLLSASLLGVMWHFLVRIIPSRLIFLLDSFISSSRGMQSSGVAEPTGHAAKDQALRRILGLDGAGILGKLNLTRNGAGFSTVVKDNHEGAPPGLGNWDNSCYQNSVIQVCMNSHLHDIDRGSGSDANSFDHRLWLLYDHSLII